MTTSDSFEIIQNIPSPTAQGREFLRSNIATLADYRHSLPEMRDNNNGVYLETRKNHQPLRLRLIAPVLDDSGHLSDSDDLDSINHIE